MTDAVIELVDLPGPDIVVRPIVKRVLPYVVDLVVAASKGKFGINKPKA